MTRSAYIVGGAAAGKSTFMAELLRLLGAELREQEVLWQHPNSKGAMISLRGHRFWPSGVYLGKMRDHHPGTDGLDRVSSVAALQWLEHSRHIPQVIVGEGLTLAHAGFLAALPGLLLIHLEAGLNQIESRCAQRGTTQAPSFLKATATRARNTAAAHPGPVLTVNTEDELSWNLSLDLVYGWLNLG